MRNVLVVAALLTSLFADAKAADTVAAVPPPPPAAASISGPDPHVAVLTGEQVVQILDETVEWYRTLGTQQENADQPSDLLIVYANRQTADKVIALAFEIARANAELLSSDATASESATDVSSPQALTQQQNQLAAQRQSIQQELTNERQNRPASPKALELQGELSMVDARKNLLETMSEFVNESDPKGQGANVLKAQIDAIAATIPASSAPGSPAPAAQPTKSAPSRTGIWSMATASFSLHRKIDTIDAIDRHTASLAQVFESTAAAPLKQLKAYTARSDALALQADSGAAALGSLRGEFDTLAWLFKQTSAILIPLTKEQVLLQQYRHNLGSWRDAARREYHDALGALGVRLGLLLGILAVVFAFGEIWRRAVLRYTHEARRRSQLLLVRKFVIAGIVIVILGLNLVTEVSTFATFAGLLTAGIAVAMQSVLVSVVGYFFLIGKYGIRVGDRIQIGTVVGEVIELGLVRMHLMELNTTGPLGPTGRVVAFANLIVFQAAGGLFKQIPGVNLSWHETTLTLPVVDDYGALKQNLLAAISAALVEFRDEIDRQTQEIARTTASMTINDSSPQVQMHLSTGRMEALIRYPVNLKHAAEIDESVAAAILKVTTAASTKMLASGTSV